MSGELPFKCSAVHMHVPLCGSSQPGRTQLLLMDSLTQYTPHSLATDVDSTQNQPLLFCSSPPERVNKRHLFRRPTGSRSQNRTHITRQTHTEPLWVLSLSLLCFARHNSAGRPRNVDHQRHHPCEFIPSPPDVIQLQRPRGFHRSREVLTCVGILTSAEGEMIYKKSLAALPPAGCKSFPLVLL